METNARIRRPSAANDAVWSARIVGIGFVSLVSLALAAACGGKSDESQGDDPIPSGGAKEGTGGGPPQLNLGGEGAGPVTNPCASFTQCSTNQYCVVGSDGSPTCEPHTCTTLDCGDHEACIEAADGAYCEDISCGDGFSCPDGQTCDIERNVCMDVVCTPGASRCDDDLLLECNVNGSDEFERFTCGSASPYFTSECISGGLGSPSGCTCEGDWDCPPYTICSGELCTGTGQEPTCTLPPAPFSADDTQAEIQWGSAEGSARYPSSKDPNTPYPDYVQVGMTPLVANLDDDNGDGRIDENDIPEILFISFDDSSYTADGVLRAIHGGGPNRGQDYFALCALNDYWREGAGFSHGESTCTTQAVLDATSGLAVGDLDYDGAPEIVGLDPNAGVHIFDNTGAPLVSSPSSADLVGGNPYPTLANLDNEGLVEIVVGNTVFGLALEDGNIVFDTLFVGDGAEGRNGMGPVPCVANVDGDAKQEIIAGPSVFALPERPAGETSQADCSGNPWCDQELELLRRATDENGSDLDDGFCAVADLLGADPETDPGPKNPLDGKPEVALIAEGRLYIFDPTTGETHRDLEVGGNLGGPPNVDDFDGDGFPEVGAATATSYAVFDLQSPSDSCPAWETLLDPDTPDVNSNPERTTPEITCREHSDCGDEFGCNRVSHTCVCLHNGWRSTTEDESSEVTGSSVFDFNGDGAAEVVYNDECKFRVYDGLTGRPHIQKWSESRTQIEYPVVADVDKDGNAEIVFATTTESRFCSERDSEDPDTGTEVQELFNAGIEVWGDARDLWMPARRVWNQHAYHVTNVREDGSIPLFEPESFVDYNGRVYNTYRSNPRNYGVAPDLIVKAIQVTSPDASCGELGAQLDIIANLRNDGDLLVGPDIVVGFYGRWSSNGDFDALLDEDGQPIQRVLGKSLDAKREALVTVKGYDPEWNDESDLPQEILVRIDDTSIETECIEDNNEATLDVTASEARPELSAEIDSVEECPPKIKVTVSNSGTADAEDVVVAFFAGDPGQGGVELTRETLEGTLAVGDSEALSVTLSRFPVAREATPYVVVDPDRDVPECNDGDNETVGTPTFCGSIIQ